MRTEYTTKRGTQFGAELLRAQYGRGVTAQIRPGEAIYRCWGDDCSNVVKFYIQNAPNLSLNTMMLTIGWIAKPGGAAEQYECLECQKIREAETQAIATGRPLLET